LAHDLAEVIRSAATGCSRLGRASWSQPPVRVGKLSSMGAVYRNLNETLRQRSEEVRAYDGGHYDAHLLGIDILRGVGPSVVV